MLYQYISQDSFFDTLIDSRTDGSITVTDFSLYEKLSDSGNESSIFPQRFAFRQYFIVRITVDVDHRNSDIHIALTRITKCIRQLQHCSSRHVPIPIAENDAARGRQRKQSASVNVHVIRLDVFVVLLSQVHQTPHRHIGIPGALLFIQIDPAVDQKRHIVFHPQVYDILYRCQFQNVRIVITCVVQSIV